MIIFGDGGRYCGDGNIPRVPIGSKCHQCEKKRKKRRMRRVERMRGCVVEAVGSGGETVEGW
jgi:hypothetical protein